MTTIIPCPGDVVRLHKAKIPKLPQCDECKTNRFVEVNGPEMSGSEFYCHKCKASWAEAT